MRRRTLVLVGGAVVLATVPAIASLRDEPEAGVRGFRPDRRTVAYRTTPVTTSETRFRRIPRFEDVLIQTRGPATVRFSGDFSGAPVHIRILRRPSNPLLPGVAHFTPSGAASSFSYDFLDPIRTEDVGCPRYAVSWRSPTGAEVTLNHATVVIDSRFYEGERGGPRAVCVD